MSAWGRGRGGGAWGNNGNNGNGNGRGRGQPPPQTLGQQQQQPIPTNGNGNNNPIMASSGSAFSSSAFPPPTAAPAQANGNPWNRQQPRASAPAPTPAQIAQMQLNAAVVTAGGDNGNNNANGSLANVANGMQRLQIRNAPPTNSDPAPAPMLEAPAPVAAVDQPARPARIEGAEGGVRGRRLPAHELYARRADYVQTRQNIRTASNEETSKVGKVGTPVNLEANYFPLKKAADWTIYHYHVDFTPEQKSTKLKRGLIYSQKAIIGGHASDGDSIWTWNRLQVPMELSVITKRGDEVLLKIKLAADPQISAGDPRRLQIFNVILRSCLGDHGLGLALIRRNYFDPTAQRVLDQQRITIWPGYFCTLRQFEEEVMLNVGIKHKILRNDSALAIMKNRNENEIRNALVGSIVLTKYNNRTYKITDIDFSQTPASTFEYKKEVKSYFEYYQTKYNQKIENMRQPLLVAQMKKKDYHRAGGAAGGPPIMETIFLIPELCYMTGITDDERANFQFMKELNRVVMQSPTEKMRSVRGLMQRLRSNVRVQQTLNGWGLEFDMNPVVIVGRSLPAPNMYMAPKNQPRPDTGLISSIGADWTRAITSGRAMDECVELSRWIIITHSSVKPDQCYKLQHFMTDVGRGLGVTMTKPLGIFFVGQGRYPNPSEFQQIIQDKCGAYKHLKDPKDSSKSGLQLVVVLLPNNRKEIYILVKKVCCAQGVASQCITLNTVSKPDHVFKSVATKIIIQINAKLGGVPWKMDSSFQLPTMFVGFDVHHSGKGSGGCGGGGGSIGAMVATRNKPLSKFYSTVSRHDHRQELSTSMGLNIIKCVHGFSEHNNKCLPGCIVFFRDGVGEGQLQYVVEIELKQMKDELNKLYTEARKPTPRLTFIVVSKRINARLFKPNGPSGSGQYSDAQPGTVVDTKITLPERCDFYMTSCKAPPNGTATPTSYNVIWDDNHFTADQIQEFAYRQCHAYYNWSGTVSVPAVCQYAHKLAFLTGTANLSPDTLEALSGTLYYL